MATENEIDNLCQKLAFSEAARETLARIRSSAPSRRVQGGRRNVSGSYPSRKMGVTIQFESHRNELARIYELEHNPQVLEYYDQPPAIELCYLAKSGRQNRHLYTPDFFVIRTDSIGWEECKTEQDLVKLSENSPNRYRKGEDELWHCPPGDEYAEQFGFYFRLWSSAEISWTFQENFIYLEDYFELEPYAVDDKVIRIIFEIIHEHPGIALSDLFQKAEAVPVDDI
jgi:hypothetical protein